MKPLYRTTQAQREGAPMPFLEQSTVCSECGAYRSHGNHQAFSKKRQVRYQAEKRA